MSPYIDEAQRLAVAATGPKKPGELNYVITVIIKDYVEQKSPPSYADLNEVLGVLEAVKQEFYRRVVAPYEEMKKAKNGDVY